MNVTRVLKMQSAARKKSAAATDMSSTMTVVIMVSRRVGQVTLATSVRTCCMNSKGLVLAIFSPCCGKPPPDSCLPARASVVAGVEGLEPPTPGFGDRCSSQLSYTPIQVSEVRNQNSERLLSMLTSVALLGCAFLSLSLFFDLISDF